MRIRFPFRTGVVDGRRDAVCISGVFFQAPAINIEQLLVLFGHVEPQVVLWSDIVGKIMAEQLLVDLLFACQFLWIPSIMSECFQTQIYFHECVPTLQLRHDSIIAEGLQEPIEQWHCMP